MVSLFIGIYLIYFGLSEGISGAELSETGGQFSDIYSTFGNLWEFFGLLYMGLGVICLIIAMGLMGMKEGARRNGVPLFWSIAIMSFFYGAILGYIDPVQGVLPMLIVGVCVGMAVFLRSHNVKETIEFQGQGRGVIGSTGSYHDLRKAEKEENRAMKRGRKHEVRHAGPVHIKQAVSQQEATITRKCSRCGTVNVGSKMTCKMCANDLE